MDQINSRLKYLQGAKLNSKNWNVTWNLGVILTNLVEINNPKTILEVGTSNGFSTLCIAKGSNPNSIIYTIDINNERLSKAKQNFQICNLKNIFPICSNIICALKNFKFVNTFDFIFLDAMQKDYLEIVLLLIELNLMSKTCLIVCDNISSGSKVEKFVDYMNLNFDCELINLDSGFLVAKYTSSKI